MPTYGRPELLERALRSVLNNGSRRAGEVEIVVSDNSSDVNAKVCDRLLPMWAGPTQYLANEVNIGAVPNFNQSGRAARGRYVVFLHDDDRLLKGSLDAMVGELTGGNGGRAAYLFGVEVIDELGLVRRRQDFPSLRELGPAEALMRVLTDSTFVRMPGVIIRRDVFDGIGGFDEAIGNPTDFDLMVRVFASYGVTCVPAVTAQYMVHSAAATSGMFNQATVTTLMTVFDRAVASGVIVPERRIRRAQVDWFHQFILGGAYRELRRGRPDEARSVLALFDVPQVRALGRSRRWAPIRAVFSAASRIPGRISAPFLTWVGRLRLERLWHPK